MVILCVLRIKYQLILVMQQNSSGSKYKIEKKQENIGANCNIMRFTNKIPINISHVAK